MRVLVAQLAVHLVEEEWVRGVFHVSRHLQRCTNVLVHVRKYDLRCADDIDVTLGNDSQGRREGEQ